MKHWVKTVLEDACWQTGSLPDHILRDLKRIVQIVDSTETHRFRTPELEMIADEISECSDLGQLSNILWRASTSTGFQNFAIFVLSQGSCGTFRTRICTSYNEAWINRYQAKNYQFIDPVISEASRRDGWFLFSDLKSNAPAHSSFWKDAEDHQIGRNGVCFTTTRPDGARVAVVFSTSNSAEKTKELVRRDGFDLRFLAELAVECFCYGAIGLQLPDDTLSVEELRFLYTLATSSEPKKALDIAPKYGSNTTLQSSIRAKLNVETIFQAVSVASTRGWFNYLPYDANEVIRSFPGLSGLDIAAAEIEHGDT